MAHLVNGFAYVILSLGAICAAYAAPPTAKSGGKEFVVEAAAATQASDDTVGQTAAPLNVESISDEDGELIVQTARRAVQAAWTGRPAPDFRYRPPGLRGRKTHAAVTLRRYGRIVGEGESGELDPLDAVVAAAKSAVRAAAALRGDADLCHRLAMEVELIGRAEYVKPGLDAELKFESALFAAFEPGVDGVGVDAEGMIGRARPSVILASNYTPNLALQHAEKLAGFTSNTKREIGHAIRYFRFRTAHLWQLDSLSRPVRLKRGVVPVSLSAVDERGLDDAIAAARDHLMRRRRQRDAWFAFEFTPSTQRYSERNTIFGQFQAAWGLGFYARAAGCGPCRESAGRILAAAQNFVVPFADGLPARAVVAEKDAVPLASTALYLATMCCCPWHEVKVDPVEVADALRLVQKENGRFDTTFPPDPPIEGHAYSAGAAMLGLLEYVGDRPDAEVDRAIRQAVRFYRPYFARLPDRTLAGWMAPALASAYRRKPDPPVSDFLFEIGDWLAAHQVTPEWKTWPEIVGAFLDRESTRADATSGLCLAAMSDALWMARRLGDSERARRYEQAVRCGARFVMQLQFRADECYYLGGPDDVVGGVRSSLWDHALRADETGWALWGLTRAREELYGPLPAWKGTAATQAAAESGGE